MAKLKTRILDAQITAGRMKIFQKVVAIMECGQGRIDRDDLIAASFLAGLPRRSG